MDLNEDLIEVSTSQGKNPFSYTNPFSEEPVLTQQSTKPLPTSEIEIHIPIEQVEIKRKWRVEYDP